MKKILLTSLMVITGFAYTNCTMCHNGSYKAKLDKYTPAQIIQMMNEYKNGTRSGMMSRFANSMSKEDIINSANKFGKH